MGGSLHHHYDDHYDDHHQLPPYMTNTHVSDLDGPDNYLLYHLQHPRRARPDVEYVCKSNSGPPRRAAKGLLKAAVDQRRWTSPLAYLLECLFILSVKT